MADSEHYYLTLDDEDETEVLELVRVDGENYYIRKNEDWQQFDPDVDNQRVWDRQILDVTPEAAEVYDTQALAGDVSVEAFTDVLLPDEDEEVA